MSNMTGEFLGDRVARRSAQVVLDDIHALWGGKRITVRGDGFAFIKIVDLDRSEETYRVEIGAERALRVLDTCEQSDALTLEFPKRPLIPEESFTTLSLVNAGGEMRSVTHLMRDPIDQRFEAVRAAISAVAENMQQASPELISRSPGASPTPPAPESPVKPARAAERILEATIQFFKEDKWTYERSPDRPVLRLPFQGKNGKWMCFAQARVTQEVEQLLFYSVLPVTVPSAKRAAVAEFIVRANYGMAIGNFEMDYGDGEVRYKTSIDATDTELSFALVKPVVYTNVLMLDKYLPGFMAVIYANASPEEAVKQVEG